MSQLITGARDVQRAPGQTTPEIPAPQYNAFVQALYNELAAAPGWQVNWHMDKGRRKTTPEGYHYFTARKLNEAGAVEAAPLTRNPNQERALTWFSTVVKTFLEYAGQNPVEVQCACHHNEFFLAANDVQCNVFLKNKVAGAGGKLGPFLEKNAQEIIGAMSNENPPPHLPDDRLKRSAEASRIHRHSEQTKQVLDQQSEGHLDILQAMGSNVRVAEDTTPGLHAEIRIRRLNDNVTPEMIAGTRRPCLSCHLELYPGGTDKTHAGHLYSVELLRGLDLSTQTPRSVLATLFGKMQAANVKATYESQTQGIEEDERGRMVPVNVGTERYGSDSGME